MSDTPTATSAPVLNVTSFGLTDRGKVRPSNEDQFTIAELTKTMRVWQTSLPEPATQVADQPAHLFLVADGMGGHRAGERASALAVAAIEHFTLNTFRWFFGPSRDGAATALHELEESLEEADTQILAESREHPELDGMGTTVTMAFHVGSRLCVVHAGDSRAYLHRGGQLHQVTEDHTVTADLVRAGTLRADQVEDHPLRHVITNVVGGNDRGVRVEVRALDLQAGDRLLICSDGLSEMVDDGVIAETVGSNDGPEAAARRLLTLANDAGGRDNITVVIAHFDR
jgi:protein phosphatase